MAERDKVAHLLRRATFGPLSGEVDAAERAGYNAAVETLINAPASPVVYPVLEADPYATINRQATREEKQKAQQAQREQVQQLTAWWLNQMTTAGNLFSEKLVFFWHGHWATSVQKVNSAHLMLAQQRVFRTHGLKDFDDFTKAMLRDAALIFWLDGQKNTRKAPNENLARELMELFTLGIGNYTEGDVKEAARALTGWTIDRATGVTRLEPARFDDGSKTILGRTAPFNVDSLADLLVEKSAGFVAARLWFRFAGPGPVPPDALERMTAAGSDIAAMAKAMFLSPEFGETKGKLVKQPVEWLLGALRQLGIEDRTAFYRGLSALDQVPLRPPSVGGWPSGTAWLTTFSTQTRLQAAEGLAARAKVTARGPDELARLLSVEAWTPRTREILSKAKNPLAMALASPEYAVH